MKLLKYFTVLLIAGIAFGSCKKSLEQNNPNTFSDENAFQTIDHIQLGVNGAYGRYATNINDVYKSALVSDELKIGPNNAGSGSLTFRYEYGADETSGADVTAGFYGYYSMIDQINRVLPHVFTVTGGTDQRKNELKGQLLALRAIAHFALLQSYSKNYDPAGMGIAIMTESNAAAKPARNTMGEVMTQIEADLNDAKNLVPAVSAATFKDTIMNKVNIAAYQARIALYRRDYDAAITYATEVINSGVKPLTSGSDFVNIWRDISESEVLFRIRLANSSALGGLFTTPNGNIQWSPSDKLTNSFSSGDIRSQIYIGTTSSGDRYVNKHAGSSRGASIVDLKACRTAEMYLIRAEAYAKIASPNITAGAADLNLLRSRRIAGYVDETFATPADLITAVLDERFKELCFEGFRIFDLKRNNLPVQRDLSDVTSTLWQTLPSTSFRFIFPIPQSEMNANPNTTQNDNY